MYRFGSLLVGIVMLVALVAACNVQIAEDGTFKVYGVEPTPTPASRTDDEGNTVEYEITPTPVYDGRLSDWNIQGAEHIPAPTPTPRPTPTPAYQQGELTFAGDGPWAAPSLAMPQGWYTVRVRVTGNEDNQHCMTYGDVLTIGCTSESTGDVDQTYVVLIEQAARLSIEIGASASYRVEFERVH